MEQGGEVILRLVRGRQSTIDGALVAVVPDVWSAILSLDGGRRRKLQIAKSCCYSRKSC